MLHRLVGPDAYAKALDLYFERHDGQACTIEDWLQVFEDTTGRDLAQFKRWYSQAGTPTLSVKETWDAGTYVLTFTQNLTPSATTPDPQPQVIPILTGLLNASGKEILPSQVLDRSHAVLHIRRSGRTPHRIRIARFLSAGCIGKPLARYTNRVFAGA